MEESSLPPVFAETAPSRTLVDDDYTDLERLREDMLNSLESMEPRIDSLQQTFDILIKQSDNSSLNLGSDIMNEINQILPRMKNIHSNSISSARKIQALSLNQQTVQTLSIPKQMRPVHDEFFAFKDEFDLALKNVASLSRNVTEKSDIIASTVNPIQNIPKLMEEIQNEMAQQSQFNKENSQYISHSKSQLFQNVLGVQQFLTQEFEQKIGLAEAIVNQMMDRAENGVDNTEKMKKALKQKQDDVKSSFNNIMTEIKKTTESKLDDLDRNIQKMVHESKKEIKKLSLMFDAEYQEMEKMPIPDTIYSDIDEAEKEKEMVELDILIERFNKLSNMIKQANSRKEGNDYEDHDGVWEGRQVTFRCFDDGTFKIIEKEQSEKHTSEEEKEEKEEEEDLPQSHDESHSETDEISASSQFAFAQKTNEIFDLTDEQSQEFSISTEQESSQK